MVGRIFFTILIVVFTAISGGAEIINSDKISNNIIQLYNKTHNLDSIIKNCCMEIKYSTEGPAAFRIHNIQILLNDTASVIRTQDSRQRIDKLYSQVTLTKETADCFKSLLFDLYSKHQSILNDSIINKGYMKISVATIWSINMEIEGQLIEESIDLKDYRFSFKNPFNIQFEKILQLIWAIRYKMELEIYSLEDDKSKIEDWIIEKFNGNYYETSNIIY